VNKKTCTHLRLKIFGEYKKKGVREHRTQTSGFAMTHPVFVLSSSLRADDRFER
jgi:hypothetical protein